ncbi:hypothetical protein AAG663_17665 [Bacillus licheniformis]
MILNSIAMFYLAGIIFPLDRNNPYMGIFSFGMLLLFLIPLFFIVNYAVDNVTGEALLFFIPCLELLLILLLYGGFKWRSTIMIINMLNSLAGIKKIPYFPEHVTLNRKHISDHDLDADFSH